MDQNRTDFSSFLWAGFECTYALAENRRRLDLLHASKHDEYVYEDYQLIKAMGMTTAREGLAWSQIDRHGVYTFDRFEKIMQAGAEARIQQIWDLNHFDYPDDLDPFSEEFIYRFAKYAEACVILIRKYQQGTLCVVPINEISFFAWIGADQGHWAPYLKGPANGERFKKQLVRASIAAMDAMRTKENSIRFIQVDPFMRRIAREPANAVARKHAKTFNEVIRFQAWDMLSGRTHPELGGDARYLDIIGVNYYFHNQEWVLSRGTHGIAHDAMKWQSPYRVPVGDMLRDIYERYGRPIVMTETGSFGDLRYRWWKRTLAEIDEAHAAGIPIHGVCAYPTVDRPEWAGFLLPNSGLWDFIANDEACIRVPHTQTLEILQSFNRRHAML